MLTGVQKSTEVAHIEEVAKQVKVFGRMHVRDTRSGATPTTLLVFCECKETVDLTRCPTKLKPTNDKEMTWMVITALEGAQLRRSGHLSLGKTCTLLFGFFGSVPESPIRFSEKDGKITH